jgi:hypothetical protein
MKTFKIKQQDYYRTEDIEIEMTKVVAPAVQEIVKTETLTVGQIKEKIEKVKEEKRLVMERYDAEIDELKEMIDTLKVDKVKLKVFVPPPMIKNDSALEQ